MMYNKQGKKARAFDHASFIFGFAIVGASFLSTDHANAQGNSNPEVIPAQSNLYDIHTDAWWQWIVAISQAENPLLDTTGEHCGVDQSGSVWFLAGTFGGIETRDCEIPAGKKILFPVVNFVFTDFTPEDAESNFGVIESIMDTASGLQVIVDGVPLQDVDGYRFQEPDAFDIECNFEPACNGEEYAVHDGIFVMLTPLTPGEHTIEFQGTVSFPNGSSFTAGATYNITVGN